MKKIVSFFITVFIFIFGFIHSVFSEPKMLVEKPLNTDTQAKTLKINRDNSDWKDAGDWKDSGDWKETGDLEKIEGQDIGDMLKVDDLESNIKFESLEREDTEDWKR